LTLPAAGRYASRIRDRGGTMKVYSRVEGMIMSLGAPFVPIKHEGRIYVRPPIS